MIESKSNNRIVPFEPHHTIGPVSQPSAGSEDYCCRSSANSGSHPLCVLITEYDHNWLHLTSSCFGYSIYTPLMCWFVIFKHQFLPNRRSFWENLILCNFTIWSSLRFKKPIKCTVFKKTFIVYMKHFNLLNPFPLSMLSSIKLYHTIAIKTVAKLRLFLISWLM